MTIGAAVGSTLMGLIDPLLAKLGSLLEGAYHKLRYLQPGITSLRHELGSIKAALEDLSHLEESSSLVKAWKGHLQELSYDIEDCIDDFAQRLGEDQDHVHDGLIARITGWLKTMQLYHQTAGQIAELREHAVEVNDRRKRFKLDTATPCCSSTGGIDPRLLALFEEEDRLVGVEGPEGELIKWLTDGVRQRRVVSVVGSGGLGKTALANLVYKKIKGDFHCAAFVSVSRNPDINKILRDILRGVLETSNPTSDDQRQHMDQIEKNLDSGPLETCQLIEMTKKYLEKLRYFIVIDDIWCKQAWETIQFVFPFNDCTSRILTTTRINDVATHSCFPQREFAYSIKPLSSHASRRLFFSRAFCLEEECSQELLEIVDEILKKCDGLPLAIINIASLLATKVATRQEWKKVLDSIGSTFDEYHELELIKRVLLVSYRDLHHHLKTCLLHLSVFPEDHIIGRDRLIWRWIAEGFIVGQLGQNREEVGERYFNELINRNMIEVVDMDYSGSAINCRVHDIILDLLVSLSTEENFVTILNGQKLISSNKKVRRLSLQGNCEEHNEWLCSCTSNFSHVRSLGVFGDCKDLPRLKGLKTLRVLDIEDCYHQEDNVQHTEDIGSLHLLRYLYFTKVPREIGNLKLLQTLDVSCLYVQELPATIVQLHQLVRLFVRVGVRLPKGISNMRSLEQLMWFSVCDNDVGVVQELGDLIKLRALQIHWDECTGGNIERYQNSVVSSLCKLAKHRLQKLRVIGSWKNNVDFLISSCLSNVQHFSMFRHGPHFHRIPKWNSSLSTLIYLDIKVEEVQQEDLKLLKDLPVLVYLGLQATKLNQEALSINCSGFRCLGLFYFILPYDQLDCTTLEDTKDGLALIFEERSMPKLWWLKIECAAHDMVSEQGIESDFGVHHLKSLKRLEVEINCTGTRAWKVDAAESAIRNAATSHPTHPTLYINIFREHEMIND
ncbi:disease resistance protein RGA5-like [Aegilops tauschii subsp. strangulata]|uniref:Disease resistance protein RPM1 n=1 Tax=Aegilops tauschii TaxID=37682 RepID=M8CYN7_AEGTA|nr:disease resistance protein RGA5-like [Aegilops tauschii subsp. strangulata]